MADGGIGERVEEAAQMAVLGLDPFEYLFTRDSSKRLLMVELHNKMHDINEKQRKNLAVEIANQVGKLFK